MGIWGHPVRRKGRLTEKPDGKLTISAIINKEDQQKLRAICEDMELTVADAIRQGIRLLYKEGKKHGR